MNYKIAIEDLKKLILEKEDFSIPANYFLDHLVENSLFIEQSKPIKEELNVYREILDKTIAKHFGKYVCLDSLFLLQLQELKFIHGSGFLSNGKPLMLFFFEDLKMGMAVISSFGDEMTNFFRFSIQGNCPNEDWARVH